MIVISVSAIDLNVKLQFQLRFECAFFPLLPSNESESVFVSIPPPQLGFCKVYVLIALVTIFLLSVKVILFTLYMFLLPSLPIWSGRVSVLWFPSIKPCHLWGPQKLIFSVQYLPFTKIWIALTLVFWKPGSPAKHGTGNLYLIKWCVLFIPIWTCYPCHPYFSCLFLDVFVFKVSHIKCPESLGVMWHISLNNNKKYK